MPDSHSPISWERFADVLLGVSKGMLAMSAGRIALAGGVVSIIAAVLMTIVVGVNICLHKSGVAPQGYVKTFLEWSHFADAYVFVLLSTIFLWAGMIGVSRWPRGESQVREYPSASLGSIRDSRNRAYVKPYARVFFVAALRGALLGALMTVTVYFVSHHFGEDFITWRFPVIIIPFNALFMGVLSLPNYGLLVRPIGAHWENGESHGITRLVVEVKFEPYRQLEVYDFELRVGNRAFKTANSLSFTPRSTGETRQITFLLPLDFTQNAHLAQVTAKVGGWTLKTRNLLIAPKPTQQVPDTAPPLPPAAS